MPGLVALVVRHGDVPAETLGTQSFGDPAPMGCHGLQIAAMKAPGQARRIRRATAPLLGLVLFVAAALAVRAADDAERCCREFLTHLPPAYLAATGTPVRFTGEFTALPAALEADLQRQFPEEIFRMANMTFRHWGDEPVHLLLVVDREQNTVRSYLWDVWFDDAPFSFGNLFGQQGQGSDAGKAHLGALARLLGFQMGWTAGEVTVEDGVVFAPLMNPDKEVWRVMRSRVSPEFPGEPLAIVRPEEKYKTPGK